MLWDHLLSSFKNCQLDHKSIDGIIMRFQFLKEDHILVLHAEINQNIVCACKCLKDIDNHLSQSSCIIILMCQKKHAGNVFLLWFFFFSFMEWGRNCIICIAMHILVQQFNSSFYHRQVKMCLCHTHKKITKWRLN